MNLILIDVSTRKFAARCGCPGGDVLATKGDGRSKSAVPRRFVALSGQQMAKRVVLNLSRLDLIAIQIDSILK